MSEASEVRKAPVARTLGLHCEKPPPVVPMRPARPTEIPPAALSFTRAALAAGWAVSATYALGWRVDSHGTLTGQLRASVALRGRRGEERFVATWATPWPIPPGVEPPGLDAPPELASHLPRHGLAALARQLGAERRARLKADAVVKWAFDGGVHWVRPAPPLGVIGGEGTHGWQSSTELKRAVTSPPRSASA